MNMEGQNGEVSGYRAATVEELAQESLPPVEPTSSGLGGKLYSALTWLIAPAVAVHMASRRWRGRETYVSMCEKLTLSMKPRRPGPVLWFHAVSIGESAVALPVVHRCLEEHPNVTILFTTGTVEAYSLLINAVPKEGVHLQFLPIDLPWAVHRFLAYWKPAAAVFVESELWPNLISQAHRHGVKMALLNGRMSVSSFLKWHNWSVARKLIGGVLSHFSLIVPQSDLDVGRFRLLGAELWQMPGWCADLKYAAAMGACVWQMWKPTGDRVAMLSKGVEGRDVWVAASTHDGEEAAVGRVHNVLRKRFPRVLTLLVPRHPWRSSSVMDELSAMGMSAMLWSQVLPGCAGGIGDADVLVVDMVGELPLFFSVAEVAFIGGSLFEGSRGHNLAEAAVAGCAVLVGPHAGHFSQMAEELNHAAHELSIASQADIPPTQADRLDPTFIAGLPLPVLSPMQRFGSPHVARAMQRRRPSGRGEPSADGLTSLEDELAGRRHRRSTHHGGTPGVWWGSTSQSSPDSSSQLSSRSLPRLDTVASANSLDLSHQFGIYSDLGSPAASSTTRSQAGASAGSPVPLRAALPPSGLARASSGRASSDVIIMDMGDAQGSPVTPRIQSGSVRTDPERFNSPPLSIASTEPSGPLSRTHSPYRSGFSTPGQYRTFDGTNSPRRYHPRDDSHTGSPDNRNAAGNGRYPLHRLIPAHELPPPPLGPCIWTVQDESELATAVGQMFVDPVERQSRGHAASCAAADLAANLVGTVWELLDVRVIRPALAEFAAREAPEL